MWPTNLSYHGNRGNVTITQCQGPHRPACFVQIWSRLGDRMQSEAGQATGVC